MNSTQQTSSPISPGPSRQLSPEDLAALKGQFRDSLKRAWTREELGLLAALFREPAWELYLRYLSYLEISLEQEVWRRDIDHNYTMFLRGQKRVLNTIFAAGKEMARLIDEYDTSNQDKDTPQ
jgi:hypothetical protein